MALQNRVTNWNMRLLFSKDPGAPVTDLKVVAPGEAPPHGYIRVPVPLRLGRFCPEHRLDLAFKKNYYQKPLDEAELKRLVKEDFDSVLSKLTSKRAAQKV